MMAYLFWTTSVSISLPCTYIIVAPLKQSVLEARVIRIRICFALRIPFTVWNSSVRVCVCTCFHCLSMPGVNVFQLRYFEHLALGFVCILNTSRYNARQLNTHALLYTTRNGLAKPITVWDIIRRWCLFDEHAKRHFIVFAALCMFIGEFLYNLPRSLPIKRSVWQMEVIYIGK